MIKINYSQLNDKRLTQALEKLAQCSIQEIPVLKVRWNIQRIIRKVEKEIKLGQDLFQKILKEFVEVDDKGNFVWGTDNDGSPIPGKFIVKDEEGFKKKNEEFLLLEFEIASYPIKLSDLELAPLTSLDLMGLEPLIDESDVAGLTLVE